MCINLILYNFRMRTRNFTLLFRFNFGLKISCPLCFKDDDTQEHLFTCEKLTDASDTFEYQKIFSNNPIHITNAAQICKNLYSKREKLLMLSKDTTPFNQIK